MKFYYTVSRPIYEAATAPDVPSPWRSCVYADLEDGDLFLAAEFRDRSEKVAWEAREGVAALPSLYSQDAVSADVKTKLDNHLTSAVAKQSLALGKSVAVSAPKIADGDRTSDVLKKLAAHHGDFLLPEDL